MKVLDDLQLFGIKQQIQINRKLFWNWQIIPAGKVILHSVSLGRPPPRKPEPRKHLFKSLLVFTFFLILPFFKFTTEHCPLSRERERGGGSWNCFLTKKLNMSVYIKAVWETSKTVSDPKNHFSGFLFLVLFRQKIRWSSDQRFHNASDYFEKF